MPAVLNASTTVFDASESTGEGLSYRIEFGDGRDIFERKAEHVPSLFGTLVARLTVTDRFGRVSVDQAPYEVFRLVPGRQVSEYWVGFDPQRLTCGCLLFFYSQNGRTLTGALGTGWYPQSVGLVAGFIAGDRELHLQLRDGSTLDGEIALSDYMGAVNNYRDSLRLTVHGGPWDGKFLEFFASSPY